MGRVLTLGHNYSSPARSSPAPGRYLTPWRVPAFQRAEREITQHSSEKDIGGRAAAAAYRVSTQQYDYNPCELRKAGVFLPQVSGEMASAVAVAAKD